MYLLLYVYLRRMCHYDFRGVARGGGRGDKSPLRNLADQLTLFKPGWADFAPHSTASPPPQSVTF